MSSFGGTIHHDELLWLFGSLSGSYRLPFDAALVAQSFISPYDHAVLREAARFLGFKTGTRATVGLDWQKLLLPAVGFFLPTPETDPQPAPDSLSSDQFAAEATDPPPHTLLVILKIEGEQRLYFRIGSQAPPEAITTAEAAARLGSELLLVGKESVTADDEAISGSFPDGEETFRLFLVCPRAAQTEENLAGYPLRLSSHSAGGPRHPVFPPGDHRQGYCPPEQKHPDRPRLCFHHVHALQSYYDLARQFLVLHAGNCIDTVSDSKISRHLIPRQLKRVIKSLLKKQGQKQQQKLKQKWNRGSAVQLLMNLNVQLKLGGFLSWSGGPR